MGDWIVIILVLAYIGIAGNKPACLRMQWKGRYTIARKQGGYNVDKTD